MSAFALRETNDAIEEITKLFHFVWPAALGLWNLRLLVEGYEKITENPKKIDINARLATGSGIFGCDLIGMCKDYTWENQKEVFAEILLTNLFSIYDGWAESIADGMNSNSSGIKINAKDFYRIDENLNAKINNVIKNINTDNYDNGLKLFLMPTFRQNKKYSFSKIDNLIMCYLFFKESRNSIIHRNGIADKKLMDAYDRFLNCATPSDLGVKEVPEYIKPVLGDKVSLSLRGVVGFSEIIIRIIITVDAEISASGLAKRAICKKLKNSVGGGVSTISGDGAKAYRKICGIFRKADLPKPKNHIDQLREWMIENNLVYR